jgi:hypothetical protein
MDELLDSLAKLAAKAMDSISTVLGGNPATLKRLSQSESQPEDESAKGDSVEFQIGMLYQRMLTIQQEIDEKMKSRALLQNQAGYSELELLTQVLEIQASLIGFLLTYALMNNLRVKMIDDSVCGLQRAASK